MLEVEPGFYLAFFRSHFARHKVAVCAALDPCFTYFESSAGIVLDRPAIAEALIRMQLSTLMVPADEAWLANLTSAPDMVERLLQLIRPATALAAAGFSLPSAQS